MKEEFKGAVALTIDYSIQIFGRTLDYSIYFGHYFFNHSKFLRLG